MDKADNIRCMLLPLAEDWLLVPNVAVAEVIAYVEPDSMNEEDFKLGEIDWRGVKVPIMAFEHAASLAKKDNSMRDRIAILYHPEGNENNPYLGVKMTDIPKAFLADPEILKDEAFTTDDTDYILNQLSYDDKRVFIPNLDALFEALG